MTKWINKVHFGDCLDLLREMPDGIAQTCITSPPYYGLRDYGHPEQLGLEPSPEAFVAKLVAVFREVRRVLRDDGTAWINIGDSYAADAKNRSAEQATTRSRLTGGFGTQIAARRQPKKAGAGIKPKDLIGIPWMLAFALRADGWYLRQDIIWAKPNPMPESVRDRCTKSHEYIFLLSKSARYHCDMEAIKEPATYSGVTGMDGSGFKDPRSFNGKHSEVQMFGARKAVEGEHDGTRNKRSVWTVSTKPYAGAHFATFPPDLIEPCILAGAPGGGVVLDPFIGSGTTGAVAQRLGRAYIGCELNRDYEALQQERLLGTTPGLEFA